MYYNVIKHDGYLKREPQASVFCISRVFSNVRSVLSQYNTLALWYRGNVAKNIKTRFLMRGPKEGER